MAKLDPDVVRHALKVAQEHGFRIVELEQDGSRFAGTFRPHKAVPKKKRAEAVTAVETTSEPTAITAPMVGYFRFSGAAPKVGDALKDGQAFGVIDALGIANDVVAAKGGEVVDVLVTEGAPVEYGQTLLYVRPQ